MAQTEVKPMKEKNQVSETVIHSILQIYGMDAAFSGQREYISYSGEGGDDLVKVILSVLLEKGKRVVIKLLREQDDLNKERTKIEKQSAFSEFMRQRGIKTTMRYMANGRYCNEYIYNGRLCHVTIEDWCGNEIMQINEDVAYKIGALMARMHTLSLMNNCEIGCGTLFSAAYWNDVDSFQDFCEITENENLDQRIVAQIKKLHDEKLEAIRNVWGTLPKAAVQGDLSINNLVYGEKELTVFDYNNAGDEVLISDLVMEGLLTAYEMDMPEKADSNDREKIFPAMLNGYLSIRKLSEEEANAAWLVYTLYHALWFTRVVYKDESLQKLVERADHAGANRLLVQMLADMMEKDDGRFRR